MRDGTLNILGLDPGGTTGWSLYTAEILHHPVDPDLGLPTVEFFKEKYNSGQLGPHHHHLELWHLLEQLTATNTIIVCESFEFRRNDRDRPRDNIVLDSKEYIGVVNLYEQYLYEATRNANPHHHFEVVYQTAGGVIPGPAGNAFWTDEKLKAVGHFATPKTTWRHANDATRHLLNYMVFKLGRKDLLEPLKDL